MAHEHDWGEGMDSRTIDPLLTKHLGLQKSGWPLSCRRDPSVELAWAALLDGNHSPVIR